MIYCVGLIAYILANATAFQHIGLTYNRGLTRPLLSDRVIGGLGESSRSRQQRLSPLSMSSVEDKYYQGKSAYEVLDVQKGSNDKDIKRAYRKAIAKWHPDKFPDDEEAKTEANMRMQRINRAYYCIGEEDRRRRYDQYGEEGVGTSAASEEQLKAAGGPGMGGFGGMGGQQVDVGDISDIFDAFFGGQGGGGGGGFGGQQRRRQANPNAPQAGEDLQVEVEIPFMSVVKGSQEKVRVRRLEQCGTCTGSGVKPGAKISSCSTCGCGEENHCHPRSSPATDHDPSEGHGFLENVEVSSPL